MSKSYLDTKTLDISHFTVPMVYSTCYISTLEKSETMYRLLHVA